MSDDLPRKLAAGDAAAYQQAYDRYGSAMYRTALRILGSQHDAEDAVQEVFGAMVKSRHRLMQVANLKAYLFASLRHAAAGIYERRKHHATIGLEDVMDCSPEHADTTQSIWTLVRSLPMEQREVLSLKIQGGLTFRDIGTVCGVSPNTAASRYRYALQKVKQALESQE